MTIVAQNPFRGHTTSLDGPFMSALTVTPDNANDLVNVCRGVTVSTAGNLQCQFLNDSAPVTIAVIPGYTYRFMLTRVFATGTTCGTVTALY